MPQDDWGFDDKTAPPKATGWDDGQDAPKLSTTGSWNGKLTAVSFFAATAAAVLIQWLSLSALDLDVVQVGLWFFCPVAAVLFSAFVLEYSTSAMTPRFSRTGQAIVALVASAMVFLMGCLGQISYLSFTYHQNNYVFLIDKSNSMGYFENRPSGNDARNQRKEAFSDILAQLPNNTKVGLVLFSDVILGQYPISPLNTETRLLMTSVLDAYDNGGTDFYLPLRTALDMLAANAFLDGSTTHIILLTDGDSILNNTIDEITDDAGRLNAVISCIKLGDNAIKADLAQVILENRRKKRQCDGYQRSYANAAGRQRAPGGRCAARRQRRRKLDCRHYVYAQRAGAGRRALPHAQPHP